MPEETLTRFNDPRIEEYYKQIPKWVDSNKAYRKYLYKEQDFERLFQFNYNQKRRGKENRRWPIG